MSKHEEGGEWIAIHSVCVREDRRRKGVALAITQEYIGRVKAQEGVKGLRLIAHEELIPLYEKAGFQNRGKSKVVHGEREWYELGLDFQSEEAKWKEGEMNEKRIYCKREGCRSLILRERVGKFVNPRSSDVEVRFFPPL
jgi:hypothetical protein